MWIAFGLFACIAWELVVGNRWSRPVVAVAVVVAAFVLAIAFASAATITTGNGSDDVVGTSDPDTIDSGNGNDVVHAGSGADVVRGGNGDDQLFGEAGADQLFGENGSDVLDGGFGSDTGWGANGDDRFVGGDGHDVFDGDNGDDEATGGAGLDVLFADHGSDVLSGGADSDVLAMIATGGNPTLAGDSGRDVLVSARGTLRGGDGDDVIAASGNATVDAGAGDDTCYVQSGIAATGCEHVVTLGSSNQAASLVLTDAPEDGSTITSDHLTFSVAATNAAAVWCVASTGFVAECSAGEVTIDGLTDGPQAVAVVAISNGSKVPAVQVRRFDVQLPVVTPGVDAASSPAADTFVVDAHALATANAVRATFEDGGAATWLLDDERVTVAPAPSSGASQVTIVDPNLGHERVTNVALLDTGGAVVASLAVDVLVESSVQLEAASSPAPSTLTITGSGFASLDRVRLVHDGGVVEVAVSDPGVSLSSDEVQITSAALDGLHITQIDAVVAFDGLEVMDSLSVDITVLTGDQTAPAISVPGDLVREATSSDGAQVDFAVTAVDDVDGNVAVACDPSSGSTFVIGTTVVTCAASDAAGNDAQAIFSVTVRDTTPPALALPDTITVDAPDATGALVTYDVTATDAVDGDRPVACDPASGTLYTVGTTIVTCESADASGNTGSGTFLVNVRDVTAPVLSLDGDPIAQVTSETGGDADFDFAVRALDDVDGALDATCDPASGAFLAPGTYPVHCEATDSSGNTGSIDFDLTVVLVNAYTAAEDRITTHLPHIFEEGYHPVMPMSTEVSMPDAETLIVDAPDANGIMRRVIAKGLFGYVDDAGNTHRIDTDLTSDATGFAPTSVAYTAHLPLSFADGISWSLADGAGEVHLTPVGVSSNAAPGALASGADHVLYPNVWSRIDAVATTRVDGISEHFVARASAAPHTLAWNVQLPAGASLTTEDDEVYVVLADTTRVLLSHAPVAQDAAARSVAAWYDVSSDASGTVLTLTWADTALPADSYGDPVPLTFPVDIDPDYAFPVWPSGRQITPELQIQNSTPVPAMGTSAECFDDVFALEFRGRTYLNPAVDREFIGGPDGARTNCRLPGPRVGLEWFGFYGQFEWRVNSSQRVILRDSQSTSPIDSTGHDLSDYKYASNGNIQAGSSYVLWGDDTANGAPVGDVRLFITTATKSKQGRGDKRGAHLYNMVRVFADYDEPVATSVVPAAPESLLSPGAHELSISGYDAGIGCARTTLEISRDGASIFSDYSSGCSYVVAPTFLQPGVYTIDYAIIDGVGNAYQDSRTVRIADPISSPIADEFVGGTANVDLEVAEDLAFGSVQLWATTAAGVEFPIGDAITSPGDRQIAWDTTLVQNGHYTLSLRLTNGAGTQVLDSVAVDVANTNPLAMAPQGSASSTDIGGGFKVLHATGAVSGTLVDIAQTGPGGESFGFVRGYHSQDTRIGILGAGWRTSWEQALAFGPDHAATYSDATGRQWAFIPGADGTYGLADGFTGRLAVNPDVIEASTLPWLITYPDGRTLAFDASGRLAREAWPAGNAIHYGAPVSVGGGEFEVVVADDAGHSITGRINASGRLASLTDSLGNAWNYTYDGSGRLTTATDPTGAATSYEYNAAGAISRIVDPIGRDISVAYDQHVDDAGVSMPRAATVTDPGDADHSFDYATDGAVTESFAGRTTTTEFDEAGRMVAQTNPAGDESFADYNGLGQVIESIDEGGNYTRASYNALGQLESETDAEDNTTTYTNLDQFGNPGRIENAAGEVTLRQFDGSGNLVQETAPNGGVTTYTYAAGSPLPESKTDSTGQITSYGYSDTGKVTSESYLDDQDVEHFRTRATYDDAGRLTSLRDGDEPPTSYGYDELGRVTTVTDPLGNTATATYDDAGQVAALTDRTGEQTVFLHDARGNLTNESNALGETTTATYNEHGDMLTLTDPRGETTTWTVDNVGNILTETDPLGRVTTFTYNEVGDLISETDPDGNTDTYQVDKNGNQTRLTNPDGSFASVAFNALDEVESQTNELGQSSTFQYDSNGQLDTEIDAEGGVWRTRHDSEGRETGFVSADNAETTFTLDQDAHPKLVINPDGSTTQATYDDAGRLLTDTDERGNVTTMSYDALGRVLSEQDPTGAVTSYTYDEEGRVASLTDPNNHTSTYAYDAVGQLVSETDPAGETTTYAYDAAGNLESVTDPRGKVTTNTYDAAGQLTQSLDPSGVLRRYEYNGRGLLTREFNGDDWVRYTYNNRDRVTLVEDRGLKRTTMNYNTAGDMTSQRGIDQNYTFYTFDKLGRVVTEQSQVKGTSNLTYDAAGRIKTVTTPAGTTTYTYDVRGRMTAAAFPDTTSAHYEYDLAGNLTKITDSAGQHTFTYDDANRIATYDTWRGGHMTFGYDPAGRKTSQSLGAINQSFAYDNRDHLTRLDTGRSGGIADYTYNQAGDLLTRTATRGHVTTYDYDDAGRMSSVAFNDGSEIETPYYLYDGQGRRWATVTDPANNDIYSPDWRGERQIARQFYTINKQLNYIRERYDQRVNSFVWDSNGQMTAMAQSFANPFGGYYLGSGNTTAQNDAVAACITDPNAAACDPALLSVLRRFSAQIPDLPTETLNNPNLSPDQLTPEEIQVGRYMNGHPVYSRRFTYNARGQVVTLTQPLDPAKNHTYTYDTRGNQVTDNGLARTFDYENRLTSYELPNGDGTVQLDYDANGNLWRILSPSRTTWMEYDPDGRLVHRTTLDETYTMIDDSSYYYDEQGLAAMFDGVESEFYFPILNPRGDVTALVSDAGTVVARYRYSPWGEVKVDYDNTFGRFPIEQPFTYNGRDGVQRIYETGGYWMGARYYDPLQTRFIQADPRAAVPGSPDTAYSYASNDPINKIDPTGERFATFDSNGRVSRSWMPMGNGRVWVGQAARGGTPGYTYTYQSSGYVSQNLPCRLRPSCRAEYQAAKRAKIRERAEKRRAAARERAKKRAQARARRLQLIAQRRLAQTQRLMSSIGGNEDDNDSLLDRFNKGFNPAYQLLVHGDQCANGDWTGASDRHHCAKATGAAVLTVTTATGTTALGTRVFSGVGTRFGSATTVSTFDELAASGRPIQGFTQPGRPGGLQGALDDFNHLNVGDEAWFYNKAGTPMIRGVDAAGDTIVVRPTSSGNVPTIQRGPDKVRYP